MLETAHKKNPNARWWIKGDACDITRGIRESVNHEWSGDVDMGDGKLKEAHKKYMKRLSDIDNLLPHQLSGELEALRNDSTQLQKGKFHSRNDLNPGLKHH